MTVKEDWSFMYKPMLEPLKGSEIAARYVDEILTRLHLLAGQVRNLEVEKAELESALEQGQRSDLEAKVHLHIEREREKRQRANNDGDLMAGAAADQRMRALQALLEDD